MATLRNADLTFPSEDLVDVVHQLILHGLKDEAVYLRRYDIAVGNRKEIIEGRDEDYATLIRFFLMNMKVSAKLRNTYPDVFRDEGLCGPCLPRARSGCTWGDRRLHAVINLHFLPVF